MNWAQITCAMHFLPIDIEGAARAQFPCPSITPPLQRSGCTWCLEQSATMCHCISAHRHLTTARVSNGPSFLSHSSSFKASTPQMKKPWPWRCEDKTHILTTWNWWDPYCSQLGALLDLGGRFTVNASSILQTPWQFEQMPGSPDNVALNLSNRWSKVNDVISYGWWVMFMQKWSAIDERFMNFVATVHNTPQKFRLVSTAAGVPKTARAACVSLNCQNQGAFPSSHSNVGIVGMWWPILFAEWITMLALHYLVLLYNTILYIIVKWLVVMTTNHKSSKWKSAWRLKHWSPKYEACDV